jgi:hypothetical protein
MFVVDYMARRSRLGIASATFWPPVLALSRKLA